MNAQQKNIVWILGEMVQWLENVGYSDVALAKFYESARSQLRDSEPGDEILPLLSDIEGSLSGMGTFSDIPATSTNDSASQAEIRERERVQVNLIDQIGTEIEKWRAAIK